MDRNSGEGEALGEALDAASGNGLGRSNEVVDSLGFANDKGGEEEDGGEEEARERELHFDDC